MPYSKNAFRYPDQFHNLVEQILPQIKDEAVINFDHRKQAFKVRNQLIAFRNALRFTAMDLDLKGQSKQAADMEANARLFDAFSIHVTHKTLNIQLVPDKNEPVDLIIRRRNADKDIINFEQQLNKQFDNLLTDVKTDEEVSISLDVTPEEVDNLAKVLGAMHDK